MVFWLIKKPKTYLILQINRDRSYTSINKNSIVFVLELSASNASDTRITLHNPVIETFWFSSWLVERSSCEVMGYSYGSGEQYDETYPIAKQDRTKIRVTIIISNKKEAKVTKIPNIKFLITDSNGSRHRFTYTASK